jgi:hypothetical protein
MGALAEMVHEEIRRLGIALVPGVGDHLTLVCASNARPDKVRYR